MHRYRILTAVALAGLLLTACEDDWLGGKSADKNTVSFTLQTSGIATRSDARPAEESVIATHVYDLHDTSPEGEPLMLVETVTAIGDEEKHDGATRGTVITTDGDDKETNTSSFYYNFHETGFTGIGYAADGSSYLGTAQFTYDEEETAWTHFYKNSIAWIDGGIYYVLYACKGNEGTTVSGLSVPAFSNPSSDNGTVSFTYTMPGETSADSHQDLLFTTKHVKKTDAGTAQSITFYHMLTALRFADGYRGEGVSANTITSVTMKGLYNQGSCTFQANPDYGDNENGIKKTTTFSTDKLYQIGWTNQSGTSLDFQLTSTDQDLWVVPQAVGSDHSMTLEVTYHIGKGSDKTKTITFPSGTVWKAGERHTFSINPVNVVPSVTVSGPATNGLYTATITNTGNYPVYLRAAIVPTWTDVSGNVINVPWEGNITLDNTTQTDWEYDTDGYYYKKTYLEKVGLSTPANSCTLSFTPTASSTPSGATLKVNVAVQSVASKDMKEDNTASADKFTAIGWKKYVNN